MQTGVQNKSLTSRATNMNDMMSDKAPKGVFCFVLSIIALVGNIQYLEMS